MHAWFMFFFLLIKFVFVGAVGIAAFLFAAMKWDEHKRKRHVKQEYEVGQARVTVETTDGEKHLLEFNGTARYEDYAFDVVTHPVEGYVNAWKNGKHGMLDVSRGNDETWVPLCNVRKVTIVKGSFKVWA